MSILIVSSYPGLPYLLRQGLDPSLVLIALETFPELYESCWKDVSVVVVETNDRFRIARVEGEGSLLRDVCVLDKPAVLARLFDGLHAAMMGNDSEDQDFVTIGTFKLSIQGKYLLDPERRMMVHLTALEVSLIRYLEMVGRAGATKEQLLQTIWGVTAPVDTHTVETNIYRLRQKIIRSFGEDQLIVTEGERYRLSM